MCDYEPVDCYSEHYPRARKDHRCMECGGAIACGEVYWKRSYVFEGTAATEKVCRYCTALENSNQIETSDGCKPAFGTVVETLKEWWRDMRMPEVDDDVTGRGRVLLVLKHLGIESPPLTHKTKGDLRKERLARA